MTEPYNLVPHPTAINFRTLVEANGVVHMTSLLASGPLRLNPEPTEVNGNVGIELKRWRIRPLMSKLVERGSSVWKDF